MAKLIFISIVFSIFYYFGNIASEKSEALDEKAFWCAAVTDGESADFLIFVVSKNGRHIMSTDIGAYSLATNPTSNDLEKMFLSNSSLLLTDSSVEIDELTCQESSLEEFLAYKKSQEIPLE